MKFDDHLASYLYEHKTLKLEGIGTFTLDDKVRVPGEQEKEVYYPIEGLSFNYNPRSGTDENIITFLVKRLGKIEPLIRSDVESYLLNIKQLLNIGEAYTIEGIGTLDKNNQGIYEFTSGNFLTAKEEHHPKRENPNHDLPATSQQSGSKTFKIVVIAILSIAALSAIGWGVFNFILKQPPSNETYQQQGQADSMVQQDTQTIGKDPQQTIPVPVSPAETINKGNDAVTYKMIFEITKSKERATTRTAQLNNLRSYTQYDSIPINDSVAYYRLFLMMKVSPEDTARIKDSLHVFFGKRIFMEKQ